MFQELFPFFQVTTNATEFVTQAYFKGSVPPSYEDYVVGREKQFAGVEVTAGGRVVTFDIVMDV